MAKPIVYVGCSVTHSSKKLEDFVLDFKQRLRLVGNSIVLEWLGKNPELVLNNLYKTDFNNVGRCDLMIAIVDEPSIGLGMEIQYAIDTRRPLLCLHRKDVPISRLLRSAGATGVVPVVQYSSIEDAVKIVADFIAKHKTTTPRVKMKKL